MSQRKGKKRALRARLTPNKLSKANDRWLLDFLHDCLENGRRIRCMTIVDDEVLTSMIEYANTSCPKSGGGCVKSHLFY